MKTLLKTAILAAALASATVPAFAQPTVSRTYVEGTYRHIWVMEGGAAYCSNWNVVCGI